MAADFGLKEAVATTDADTIRSVLQNHGRRVGADAAMLVGLDGERLVSTVPTPPTRLEKELASGAGDSDDRARHFVETFDGRAYDFVAVPLRAPTTIAWILVGFDLDQALTERVAALTGLGVALVDVHGDAVLATSGLQDAVGGKAAGLLPKGGQSADVYLVGDMTTGYLAFDTALVAGDDGVRLLLLRSLRDAMAPYAEARQWLIVFSVSLLGMVAAAAVWISTGVARPIRQLTAAVRAVISGKYNARVSVRSKDEIGELAANFNRMRQAIARREQRIRHQAQHDALTDLPNRSKVIEDLAAAIRRSPAGPLAVLSIRLSRMNAVSSTLGHDASDQLISTASRHLQLNQCDGGFLGHVGTHEFVMVLPGHGLADAELRAEKINGFLATGVPLGRVNIVLQSEIGIAVYPAHGESAAELLRNAMIARTESAARGDNFAAYVPGREKHYEKRLRIVNDLRGAIQRDEIRVHYQPKMALPSGQITGAEALVRWTHDEYGPLPPDEFVPAAEEAGTIMHLTRHIIGAAIRDCRRWEEAGRALQVSVNISARDLQDEYLPHFVLEQLKSGGLAPDRLTLEVTENSIMQRIQQAISVLSCLRDIGVRVSMDDFGTGHSSLAQIRNIPLHELKIDKSFVMNMKDDAHNAAIVRTTLALAREFELDVVAEGIEDEDTLRQIAALGCGHVQGFFISRPVPAEDLLTWIAAHRAVSYSERRHDDRAFKSQVR
jgi:diguanylate cyclase (GGDEF)-like protein